MLFFFHGYVGYKFGTELFSSNVSRNSYADYIYISLELFLPLFYYYS